MKKLFTMILTTAAAVGLFFAGMTYAHADTIYTVKSGDSVWGISQQFGSTIDAIENANHIQGHLILPGQKLDIPDGKTATAATTAATATYTPASATSSYTPNYSTSSNTSTGSYTGSSSISSVASEMQARTGVSASTWAYIINRESRGQVNAANPSGAYGLFQSMHNPGTTVSSQINDAVNVYKSQGMAAWAE
mgnify:CR=1 FL=1